jgi:predicted ribosome quality control (RQC) complex YloA/Tae2 family protein
MNVDFLTLACLRDQFDDIVGARVQRVLLPDELSIGLELYAGRRRQLLASADPRFPRMLLVEQKLRRGVESETPILLLLRKWVRDGRLTDVVQPPWERILELHFEGRDGPCRLVAELIGRYSNIILVGPDGRVMDAVRRIGPDMNRYRVILPGRPYKPPPHPVGHQPPTGLPKGEWSALLASAEPEAPLHQLLPRRLLGVSPMAAREIATRASGGDPQAPVHAITAGPLREATMELFRPLKDGSWDPHIALDEDGNTVAFAPYKPRQFEHVQQVDTISDAMYRYFEIQLSADAYAAARWRVQERLDEIRERFKRTLSQMEENIVDPKEIEMLREAGELLLAYQQQVRPKAEQVDVPDYEGTPRTIKLDPALTPVENAQAYFRRYHKSTRAAEEGPARIRAVQVDVAYVEHLAVDLALAETRPEIDAVYDAIAKAGWVRKGKRGSSGQVEGPRRIEVGGFAVYVGRSARQNEEVTFRRAGQDDLWLHVRGLPGAHVVIKSAGQAVPEEIVKRAASIAAYYSSARDEHQVAVDVTERRKVGRVRGGHPGLVTYRNERTIEVEPRAE